ncbi:hypothetical protein PG990_014894 [Apiospora arundinis]|uniref:Uncharacterized protein n=1 Tax=Apiospora arundinis TaxID=335852 RepID=A0ABR2HL98_9PEZI
MGTSRRGRIKGVFQMIYSSEKHLSTLRGAAVATTPGRSNLPVSREGGGQDTAKPLAYFTAVLKWDTTVDQWWEQVNDMVMEVLIRSTVLT